MLGRPTAVTIALVLSTLTVGLATPLASAHCPVDDPQGILAGISTCPANEDLEEQVDRLNEASGDETVYVLVKDLGFHPDVVDLADGGTVVFVWGDVERGEQHDPKSSGVGDDLACRNAHEDPSACKPNNPGVCFTLSDANNFLSEPGDTYEVSFRTTDDGTVQVSEAPLAGEPVVGEPPFAPLFRDCPEGTVAPGPEPGTFVLPYHCGIHGGTNTSETIMRAALVLHA